jgi:hypothetical protein
VSFDAGRLRPADWLVGAGGVALFVFVFFFDWYGGSVTGLVSGSHIRGAGESTTGWQTFTSSRWLWLATIVVAIGSALAAALSYRLDGPVQLGALTAGFGTVSTALIVYRIAHHPSATVSAGHLKVSFGIKLGIWLGLIAALAVTLGGYLQERERAEPKPAPEPKGAFSGLTVTGEDSPAPQAEQAPDERTRATR